MRVDNFPDLIRLTTFNRDIASTKQLLTDASKELATGQKVNLSRVLGGQTGEFNLITKAIADIESSKTRMTLAENRLKQTGTVINSMQKSLTKFAGKAQAALLNNGAVGLDEIKETARNQIDGVLSHLNSSHAGRALFAGDDVHGGAVESGKTLIAGVTAAIAGATDEASIDAAITAYFDAGGGFETDIYKGGTGQASSVDLGSGNAVQYKAKADDAAFRDVLEGLVRVNFATNTTSVDWAKSTSAKINEGVQGLISLGADIGRQQKLVETTTELNKQELLVLKKSFTALAGVDKFEAANRVKALENQLDAAYVMASRLSKLSFTSYL